MSEYKLVPVKRCAACGNEKPVSEMETCMHNQMHRYVCDSKCMNDFYNHPKNPISDAAAPAVQGEPVAFCEDAALSLAERTFSTEVDERLASGIIQYAQRLHSLYTAPQPAAHQPCPESSREGAPYDDPAFESLCREHEIWGTAAAAQCAVFWEAGKRVAEQKPDPEFYIEHEILRRAMSNMGIAARSALAAHRKGGDV